MIQQDELDILPLCKRVGNEFRKILRKERGWGTVAKDNNFLIKRKRKKTNIIGIN